MNSADFGNITFVSYTALRVTPTVIVARKNWRRGYLAVSLLVLDGLVYLPRATLHYWAHALTCTLKSKGCVHKWVVIRPTFDWR